MLKIILAASVILINIIAGLSFLFPSLVIAFLILHLTEKHRVVPLRRERTTGRAGRR